MTAFLSALILVLFFNRSESQNNFRGHDCDFEDVGCTWQWNTSIEGFQVFNGEDMVLHSRNHPDDEVRGPFVDANNNSKGKLKNYVTCARFAPDRPKMKKKKISPRNVNESSPRKKGAIRGHHFIEYTHFVREL